MFAGVLDFLNGGGATILGVVIVVVVGLGWVGSYADERRKCNHRHPKTGKRCSLKTHHWPEAHRTWGGRGWR